MQVAVIARFLAEVKFTIFQFYVLCEAPLASYAR